MLECCQAILLHLTKLLLSSDLLSFIAVASKQTAVLVLEVCGLREQVFQYQRCREHASKTSTESLETLWRYQGQLPESLDEKSRATVERILKV